MFIKKNCILVLSHCPKTASMSPDRFLYTQPGKASPCHSFLVMSCVDTHIPPAHRIDKIFELKTSHIKLKNYSETILPGKLDMWISLLPAEEKPKFHLSCLDLLRRFVIESKNSLEVKNKIHLAMCALCPTIIEQGNLELLCGFIEDMAVFLGDRGFLDTIEQEVLATEYRSVVIEWRHVWAKSGGSASGVSGVSLWLGDEKVQKKPVLYRALHLMFCLGESYPDVERFVTPEGTVLSKAEKDSLLHCVRSWYLNEDVDSYILSEEKFVRNGIAALKNGGRLLDVAKCMPWDLVGASKPQKKEAEFMMIHEQSLKFARGEGPRPKPASERGRIFGKG